MIDTRSFKEMRDSLANKETNQVKESIMEDQEVPKPSIIGGLNTGSTILNLACSGQPNWGFAKGQYHFTVGDSGSGKTFLDLTCLAEANISKRFKEYRFIYDNPENGALMDFERYFGKGVADRIEPPDGTKEHQKHSATVEEFYYNVDNAFGKKKPFIYILDSMDALTTDDELKKFGSKKKARAKGKEETGSYGTSKAKINSSHLRVVYNKLRHEGQSILIMISQTRSNIGFGSQFNPKTRSGGHALTFYAALEIWFSVKKHLKKRIKGKERELGIMSRIKVKKNRLTGKERTIEVPIYHSYGIDDLGGIVNFLVNEGHWEGSEEKQTVVAPEFDFGGQQDDLVQWVQKENKEDELKDIATNYWNEIELACQVERKRKYK